MSGTSADVEILYLFDFKWLLSEEGELHNEKNYSKLAGVILILALVTSLSACGGSKQNSETTEYANQKAFLEAMAKGIQSRLDNVDDAKHINDTDEQKADYYKTLVRCELDQIEKFEEAIFEDSRFNDLAHHYIHACQMQYSGAESIKNTKLHTALWGGGSTIRSGIIVTMYEQYDLPINSATVAHYTGETNGAYSITIGSGSNTAKGQFDKEAVMGKLSTSYVITQNDSDVVFLENGSDEVIDVTLNIKIFDDNKLISTQDARFTNVLPGQTAANSVFLHDVVYDSVEVEYSTVSRGYLQVSDGTTIEDLLEFSITPTSDNAIIECQNKALSPSALVQCAVVFYRNGTPVWCSGTFTTFTVDQGQTQSKKAEALLNVKVPFDDVKVFVYTIQKRS